VTGVKGPIGVAGATVLGGSHVVGTGTLPFTGMALGVYALAGGAFLLTGATLRFLGRAQKH
jgi:hypothetical protein